jgi:hypothetical protein
VLSVYSVALVIADEVSSAHDLSGVLDRADDRRKVERRVDRPAEGTFAANRSAESREREDAPNPGCRAKQPSRHPALSELQQLSSDTHAGRGSKRCSFD